MIKKFPDYQLLGCLIGIVILFHPILAISQNLISADPSDTFDSEAIFINPAVISIQYRQVALGMKVYQLGFLRNQGLGLNTSYFSFTMPEMFSGLVNVGITGQNFSVPLYDQTNFSVIVAKRPIERLSLGFRYSLFTKSYHRKYFDLVNPADPVFANGTLKLAQSIGVGLMVFPWSTLAVGFACDHLNHPDVSLYQDKFRQPLVYDFGIRYSYTYFSSSIYVNYFQRHWQFNWLLESRPSASVTLKVGFVQQAAKFSAQFQLWNGLSLNYLFDYPIYDVNQISKGSHQIGFIYNLNYKDRIRGLQFTNYDEGKFPIFNLQSQFFVDISSDNLEILDRKIVRSVDDRIPRNALKRLTEVELAFGDSADQFQDIYKHGDAQEANLTGLYNLAKYSKTYTDYLKRFADNSNSHGLSSVQLIANPNSIGRAKDLQDSLIARYPFLDQQINIKQSENDPMTKGIEPLQLSQSSNTQSYFLNPDSVSFLISSIKMNRYHGFWKLIISDYSGREVKIFGDKGHVPDKIFWDWRDEQGKFIKPDIYYYFFQWEDKNSKTIRSQPKTFTVTRISRTLEIDVRSKPDYQKDQGSKIEIKLAN